MTRRLTHFWRRRTAWRSWRRHRPERKWLTTLDGGDHGIDVEARAKRGRIVGEPTVSNGEAPVGDPFID